MISKNCKIVVYTIGILLLAFGIAGPAQAHNDEAHSAPAVPKANVPMDLAAGTVIRMMVDNRVTGVATQYVGFLGDDGKRVTLDGKSLDALQTGSRAEAIGWANGSTFTVSDTRTVSAAGASKMATLASPGTQVEGALLLAHLDFFDSGRGEYLYLVRDDSGHVTRLNLATGEGLEAGMRIIASGTVSSDGVSLDVATLTITAAPPPKPINNGHPVGEAVTNNVLAVLVKFTDSPASDPFTQAQVQQVMTSATNSVERYYQEVSYGQQTLTVTVTPWLVGRDPSTHQPVATPAACNFDQVGFDADTAAADAGYTGTYQNRFYIMPNNAACGGWAGLAYISGNTAWSNGYNQLSVYAHELGHNFSLFHAASLTCSGGASIGGTCNSTEYGDPYDVMGNISSMHFNAMQKNKLSWIAPSTVKTHPSGFAQYTIGALEIGSAATYAVKIGIPSNPNRTYWIEYRQPLGFDSSLTGANGAQIRVANPFEFNNCPGCVSYSDDTQLLDMTPATTPGNFNDATLAVGQTFTDSTYGITVQVVSANLTQMVINVTTPGGAATSTSLVSSLNPSTVGANVAFTASVTGSAPTGTINFTDGGTTISGCGAVALTGSGNTRTALCNTAALTAGTHSIVAAYGGDASNAVSSSAPLSQVVNSKPPTTTSVISSLNPSTVGQGVTFTASVTGAAPTGTVNFTDGGTTIPTCGAVALSGAGNTRTAACTTSALTAATHSIVAAYGGDAGNAASNSSTLSQVVNKIGTTTGLVSSANPANANISVSFTATVTGGSPTGNVAFTEGGIALSGCSAVALTGSGNARTAVCSSSTLSVGWHSILASYGGDSNNVASASSAVLQGTRTANGGTNVALSTAGGVATASSTYTVSGSYPVSSINNNERAGINWTNGGGWSDGTGNAYPDWVQIDFGGVKTIERIIVYTLQDNFGAPVEPYDALTFAQYGVTDFAVQAWNGSAWVSLSTIAGNNLVKRSIAIAPYTTNSIRINVTNSLSTYSRITEVEAYGASASAAPTSTSLISSSNPSTFGANVTFTATVTGSAPTGNVSFTDGGTAIPGCSAVALIGSGNSPIASCSTTTLSAGTHSIVAAYAGDLGNAASSSSPVSQVVNKVNSSATLFSSSNPTLFGGSVTFTSQVTGSSPTGTVNFTDGGTTISGCGSVALTGAGNTRSAACTISTLSVGTHTIVAAYGGDAGNTASNSPPVSQVVNSNPGSTTTLASTPNPSTPGANVAFTATVTGNAPTGTVNFTDGGTSIFGCAAVALTGSGNLRTAVCNTSTLSTGTHSVIAAYSGDGGNAAASSTPLSQVVGTPAAVLVSAVSRRVHGGSGTFDMPLTLTPLTNPSTEPRQGPAQTIVFTFDKAITAATATVTEGVATAAAPTFSGNDVTVNLTGVNNIQYVTVTLSGVSSADGGTGGTGTVRVGFLLGDVNGNRTVTVSDVGLVNSQIAVAVSAANYLKDVNANGAITVGDKGLTNSVVATALPAP